MRIIVVCLLSVFGFSLQAQEVLPIPSASAGFHVSKNAIGVFGEYYLKPQTSIWLSAGMRISSRQLGYGVDSALSSSTIEFPAETKDFSRAQMTHSIRTGVRFYVPFGNPKWSFSYSPFVGFANRSAPSEEYAQAFAREDLNSFYLDNSLSEAAQHLELGGELGLRWRFFRSFYTEVSSLGYYEVALLNDEDGFAFDATFGLGYTF